MEDFVTLDAAYRRMYGSSMTHFYKTPPQPPECNNATWPCMKSTLNQVKILGMWSALRTGCCWDVGMLQVHIESQPLPPKKQEKYTKSHHTFRQFFPFNIREITSKNLRGKTSPSSIPMCLGLLAMRLHEVLGDASLLSQGCADYWAVWLATGLTLQRVFCNTIRC